MPTPAAQCYCPQCGQASSEFKLTITEVGFVMAHCCGKCLFRVESLVYADLMTPVATA